MKPAYLIRATGLVLTVLIGAVPVFAQSGQSAPPAGNGGGTVIRIAGAVRDEANAIPLPGVPVEIASSAQTVYTDVDGRYVIDVSPGTYEVRVVVEGYQPRTIVVTAGDERRIDLDIALTMTRFAEQVEVRGRTVDAITSTAEAQLAERRHAQIITDNLGGEEMRENGDSDAAAAMARVTGLSVVDNQYVFVRGLGERYSNTTLNGAVLPTTEPDKKVVPLDLFPSGLLSSVSVAKSYAPDRSAEFAGGLVEIVPLRFPSRTNLDASWSVGRNSLTGGDVLGYAGGGSDWRGFDDGTRALPGAVPDRKVIRGGIYTPEVGMLREDLERIGEAFANGWNLAPRTARPNQSGSVTFGTRAGKLGVVASYTQAYKEQEFEERQVFYRTAGEGELSTFSDYDLTYGTRKATTGAIGSLSYQFTPAHRLTLENFYSHLGKDEARTYEGFNSDINTDIRNQRLFWVEERLLSTGLAGEHFLRGLANSRIDWRATVAAAGRDEPDLREVLYERNAGRFVLADESQSGLRMFNTLDDDTADVAVNWSTFGAIRQMPAQLKFGVQRVDRTRDFSSRRFRFVPVDTVGLDTSRSPEELFTPANIGPRYEIKEETRTTDAYEAEQTTTAFYGMTDLTLSARLRLVGGARVERFDQRVDTFDLFDFSGDPEIIRAGTDNTDVFPAVNLVFAARPDHNLRVSFSQTVNRPEFRELAPFEFTDVVGGRAVVGNPALTPALIQSYDLRYEVFPGAEEVLAASLFVKRFDDPIERIIEPTAQLRTSFTNADSARNVGLELEARRRLAGIVLVGANYTWVDSSIRLAPQAAQVQTSLERPLAGQSRNVFNLLTQVDAGPVALRAMYNYFGGRISDVGSVGLPDILEDGRGTLDLAVSTRIHRFGVRFTASNLTDEPYDFTQGGLIQRSYRLGRTYALSVGFSAF